MIDRRIMVVAPVLALSAGICRVSAGPPDAPPLAPTPPQPATAARKAGAASSPTRPQLTLKYGHEASAIAISPDSRLLASSCWRVVRLTDVHTGRLVRIGEVSSSTPNSLAFSPDGKLLAALSRYGRCNVWNVKTGKLTASADRLGNDDGSAGFSRDGATLGIASSGELIHLWEFAKDKQPARIRLPDALLGKPRINGVGFSPREGRPMDAPLGEFACGPLRISGDLRTGASVLENGSIAIWDIAGRQVRKILPTGRQHGTFGGGIRTVSLSPDGHLLVVVSVLGYIDVWRLDGNVEAAAVKQPIDADEWPGPWGQALNGLQTRLILKPVKPGPGPPQGRSIAGDWVPYVPPEITSPGTRQIPVSEGVWWILCLQVRNETSKKLTFQWPNLAREGAIVVTHEDGRTVTFHPIAGDSQAIAAVWVGPSGDITTAGEMLLGRNYDMSRPGKYRFQFPQAEAASTLRDQVTNPTLPASNVLEFDSRQIP